MNLVEISRLEFLRSSVLNHKIYQRRFRLIICATGPSLFSASIKETIAINKLNMASASILTMKKDFHEVGGMFKSATWKFKEHKEHYIHIFDNNQNLTIVKNFIN